MSLRHVSVPWTWILSFALAVVAGGCGGSDEPHEGYASVGGRRLLPGVSKATTPTAVRPVSHHSSLGFSGSWIAFRPSVWRNRHRQKAMNRITATKTVPVIQNVMSMVVSIKVQLEAMGVAHHGLIT